MIESIVAGLAVALSAVSAAYSAKSERHARRSADAAEAQVVAQGEMARAAAQPYVWADVQVNDATGTFLCVVVGNAGPTVAKNVRVSFDPPLPLEARVEPFTGSALSRLDRGIGSLAPGKRLNWVIGSGEKLLAEDKPQPHTVTVNCVGPFGPVEPLVYEIDLSDIRESQDRPDGTVHLLTRAVNEVAKEIKASRPLRSG